MTDRRVSGKFDRRDIFLNRSFVDGGKMNELSRAERRRDAVTREWFNYQVAEWYHDNPPSSELRDYRAISFCDGLRVGLELGQQ